jgi:hemerythrin-like domain-containing protein
VNILAALLGEHGTLVAMFDRLDRDLDGATHAGEVREQAALLAAALVSHAQLEDELVFAAMTAAGAPPDLIHTMLDDHETIAAGLRRAQGTADVAEARDELRTAVALARRHFDLEERMAFPLAATLLGEARLVELGALWAERRAVWLSVDAR